MNLEIKNSGALIAKFNAKFHKMGGLIIRECALFETNGKKWITLPSRQYEVEGKKKYYPYIAFEERTTDDKFKEKIMIAVYELLKKQEAAPVREQAFEDLGELPF